MTKRSEATVLSILILIFGTIAAALLLMLNNMFNPYTKAVDAAAAAPTAEFSIDAYEDGSGVLYKGTQEIATFDSDYFLWDCTENGNGICGPGWDEYPNVVDSPACQSFVVSDTPGRNLGADLAFTYCTNGDLTSRIATDVDVEGDVF